MDETQENTHQTWSIGSLYPKLDVWTLEFPKNYLPKFFLCKSYISTLSLGDWNLGGKNMEKEEFYLKTPWTSA